jgi:hypothetical protein
MATVPERFCTHGYSDNAVAGIAGNIHQESKGDPLAVGV